MSYFEAPAGAKVDKQNIDWALAEKLPDDYRLPSFNSVELIGGENQIIDHPEIINPLPENKKLSPHMKAHIAYGHQYSEMSTVDEYLQHIGSSFRIYENICDRLRHFDNKMIFLELHKKAIIDRFQRYKEIAAKFDHEGTSEGQNQAESTREHAVVWDKFPDCRPDCP